MYSLNLSFFEEEQRTVSDSSSVLFCMPQLSFQNEIVLKIAIAVNVYSLETISGNS